MVNLLKLYKQRYSISYYDLADLAETNRLHTLITCPLLFVFGFVDLIIVIFQHLHNLQDYITKIIYFGVFTIVSALLYIISIKSKNVDRKKAYIVKTIPFYILFWLGMCATIYNFYILGQPFNGVLIYCLIGLVSLMSFSFSPLFFFAAIAITLCVLIPGVYKNFGVTGLLDTILVAILMHAFSLYKRFTEKRHILMLKKQKQNLEAKTFGNFTLLYENKVVKFSRTKSNELIAYLIFKNGSSVQTKELLAVLYGDYADSSRYGASLRNLIVDIKHTFAELEIQNFFMAEYNNFRINPEVVKCDYYDFLAGNQAVIKNFAGEFMSQYSWAEETASFLEIKALNK